MKKDQIDRFVARYIDGEYMGLMEYTQMVAEAARANDNAVLTRIAEIDGPIECSSLQEWREKVKKMARNALTMGKEKSGVAK